MVLRCGEPTAAAATHPLWRCVEESQRTNDESVRSLRQTMCCLTEKGRDPEDKFLVAP
ncbi:hypothetical protein SynA1560_00871 [Synechococcus sp. A15-60]|nr:hypothetical protein SynA1560_00871 [Synechococcus sp. A15-60]